MYSLLTFSDIMKNAGGVLAAMTVTSATALSTRRA